MCPDGQESALIFFMVRWDSVRRTPGRPLSRRILWLQAFLHLYWVGGATAGGLLDSLVPDRVTGLDFALTALFIVLALDALRARRGDLPTPILALLSALAARLAFPGEMLLTAFTLFTAGLLARHVAAAKR